MIRQKAGPAKPYTEAELALFASCIPDRARFRPPERDDGARCWVRQGPPAISKIIHCIGCDGLPKERRPA